MIEKIRAVSRLDNLSPTRLDQLAAPACGGRPTGRIRRGGRLGGLAKLAGQAPNANDGAPRILIAALRGWSVHVDCELIMPGAPSPRRAGRAPDLWRRDARV